MTMGFSQEERGLAQAKSDEELFLGFLSLGDREAFETLITRQLSFAFRVAFSACGDRLLAEEVVQECFLILAGRPRTYQDRGSGSFRRWFCTVLLNKARQLRSTGPRARRHKEGEAPARPCRARDPGASPAESFGFERIEERERLATVLAELAEELRVPLILHFQEGCSQGEIAGYLKISQSLVSRRIGQALQILKKRFAVGGAALPSSAILAALQHPELIPVPEALGSNLASRISSRPAGAAALEAAGSVPLKACGRSLMLATLAMLAISPVFLWRSWGGSAGQSKTVRPPPAEVKALWPMAPIPAAEVRRKERATWSFEQGIPGDLERLAGSWSKWVPAQKGLAAAGLSREGITHAVVFKVSREVPAGPLRFQARVRFPAAYGNGFGGVQIQWITHKNTRLMPARFISYRKSHLSSPDVPVNFEFYIAGRFVSCKVRESDHLASLTEYERPYPGRFLAFALYGVAVEEISMEEIGPEAVPDFLRNLRSTQQVLDADPLNWYCPADVPLNSSQR